MTNNQKIRIAVSGTGGGVGQSIIKALANTDYEVVALDGEALGAGLYAATNSYVIPYASKPDYLDRVLEICRKEQCRLFFPGLDAELPILTQAVDRFDEIGTKVIVSSPEVITIGDDKLATYNQLTQLGITVPETVDMLGYTSDKPPLDYPFILKRRIGGARSKDVYLINNEDEYYSLSERGTDISVFVAQEYIDGDEYTCGSVNFDGECMGIIVMRRILRDGDTYKCFTVTNEVIEAEVRKTMTAIKPFGACNVQLRLKNGKPYIFEINARCSGTTGARSLSGFNEPLMIADYLCKAKRPEYIIKEQTILRYWKELVISNEDVEKVRSTGELHQDNVKSL